MSISGNALAHLICIQRVRDHAIACHESECTRSIALIEAMFVTHKRLHSREQRRFKPILTAMSNELKRERLYD